jgi:hypothetical protein
MGQAYVQFVNKEVAEKNCTNTWIDICISWMKKCWILVNEIFILCRHW